MSDERTYFINAKGVKAYIDDDGDEVMVIDPVRFVSMELMELHAMTEEDLPEGGFEALVEHMRDYVDTDISHDVA